MTFKLMPAVSAALLGLFTIGQAAEKAANSASAPEKAPVKVESKTKPASSTSVKSTAKATADTKITSTAKPVATAKAKSAFQLVSVEQKIVEKTNAERTRHGLAPLTIDASLMQSARSHTNWMTRSQQLQHTSASVAENIAMGQTSPAEALRSWMNSPGHRANILNPRYRRIGVAAYTASNGQSYWCQQFLW